MGVVIALGGVLLLTRLIGPANWGLYAGALAVATYAGSVGVLGVDVYLVRREEEPAPIVYSQAVTLLLVTGVGLAGLGVAGLEVAKRFFDNNGFIAPLQALLLALPFTLAHYPTFAALERDLNYRAVAMVELVGQLSFYVVGVLLALLGFGVWAPVAGFWVWQVWLVISTYTITRLRPRPVWSWPLLRDMLRYGAGYSSSLWIWQLRDLVNPVVVGRFVGAEGVGYVALAARLVEALAFVRGATYRLSIAAFAKVQGRLDRLRSVLEEAMALQLLVIGPLLAGFAAVSVWLLPFLFGERWEPVLTVFPFIALGYLINALFNLHSSVLFVLAQNRKVAVFHIVHIVLFAAAAFVLVPAFGIVGYGLAEIVALLGYAVIHIQISRVFPVSYRMAAPMLLAFAPAVFAALLPPPWGLLLLAPVLVVFFRRKQQTQLKEYLKYLRWRAAT